MGNCDNENLKKNRIFFINTKANYYDKSLDSLSILGNFGIDSVGEKIQGTYYWRIKSENSGFLHLNGMVRYDDDKIKIKTYSSIGNKKSYGQDQVLFSFKKADLGLSWRVFYTNNTALMIGDSIIFKDIFYDYKLKDTLYCYIFSTFFMSLKTQKVLPENYISIIKISRTKGFIEMAFSNKIDTTVVNFYPKFSRLDSNYFKHRLE